MEDVFIVTGGVPLKGTLKIPGAKNSSLPLMTLSLLTSEQIVLDNIPKISDIDNMSILLASLGVEIQNNDQNMILTCKVKPLKPLIEKRLTSCLRASIVVLGSLLARCGYAKIALPGGCSLNNEPRSIDFHINGLIAFGAKVFEDEDYLIVEGPLTGGEYTFPKPSLTGTINLICAATSSEKPCIINNVALEPEINDVVKCLIAMGANIKWIPNDSFGLSRGSFHVEKSMELKELKGNKHTVISDRLILGTYMVAAAITKGHLFLEGGDISLLPQVIDVLEKTSLDIKIHENKVIEVMGKNVIKPFCLITSPYPGFPTDLQPQFMALACIANGKSCIQETIFNNIIMLIFIKLTFYLIF
jgi:UDP-N-acetylglucosamine 1-carboxyvinyltransferase